MAMCISLQVCTCLLSDLPDVGPDLGLQPALFVIRPTGYSACNIQNNLALGMTILEILKSFPAAQMRMSALGHRVLRCYGLQMRVLCIWHALSIAACHNEPLACVGKSPM